MLYTASYFSPLGQILLAADDVGLTGLWFEGQKHIPDLTDREERQVPVLCQAMQWLDTYFAGRKPDGEIPLHLVGTLFQQQVWELLCAIPYGRTVTYGEIAGEMARIRGKNRMSAQAVGNAIGRNPVSVIVPCHRVVGADGSLTGYAGGLERKRQLLKLERSV